MINNYYTIAAVARELDGLVSGWMMGQPYTQRKGELVLPFSSPSGDRTVSAIVSCEPSANFLVIKDRTSRARRNSVDVFPEVVEKRVVNVRVHPSDRQVAFVLEDVLAVVLLLYGSRANAFLAIDGRATGVSFLRSPSPPDDLVLPFPERRIIDVQWSISEPHGDRTVSQWLRRGLPGLGPVLCREALFRASIVGDLPVHDVPDGSLRALGAICDRLMTDLTEHPAPRIYYREDDPIQFSLVPLAHLGEVREEAQPSVSIGIFRYLHSHTRRDSLMSRKRAAQADLESTLGRKEHAIASIRATAAHSEDPDALERYGKIIQLNLSGMEKGRRSLDVRDPFESEEVNVSIPLDPAMSPPKNAERFFEKSKRLRGVKAENDARLRELSAEIGSLRALQAQLDDISTPDDLEVFLSAHARRFRPSALEKAGAKGQTERPPFRIFRVDGGFQVWVGKNSANNDLLTTRHTSPNDLWFHARGVGGSHVVLKTGTGKGEVSKRAKQQAAAIAAYYSKMKKAAHVPVSVCLGKYVRKRKGAAGGTVTIEREDVIFADPALPPDQASEDEATG